MAFFPTARLRSKGTWAWCHIGRYTRPVTPVAARFCRYCSENSIDDEKHAILSCKTFTLKRNCFFGKISSLLPNFHHMSLDVKLLAILCPANADIALCVSKYQILEQNLTKVYQLICLIHIVKLKNYREGHIPHLWVA